MPALLPGAWCILLTKRLSVGLASDPSSKSGIASRKCPGIRETALDSPLWQDTRHQHMTVDGNLHGHARRMGMPRAQRSDWLVRKYLQRHEPTEIRVP
jgi:hypothetical protein